jgi:hypothetical protein
LDEIISGAPKLYRPFIEEARYAAEHRNHYWETRRDVPAVQARVELSPINEPYPSKSQKFNDTPVADKGGNFGRVARGGLMTNFITALLDQPISGIPARYWQGFLEIFSEGASAEVIDRKLVRMRTEAEGLGLAPDGLEAIDRIHDGLRELIEKT